MANTVYAVVPFCGFDLDARDTTPVFPVGTKIPVGGSTDNQYVGVYVQASGGIAASQTDIAVTAAGQASDGTGAFIGTLAFADNDYGWVYGLDSASGT